jgi:hypothetical protein
MDRLDKGDGPVRVVLNKKLDDGSGSGWYEPLARCRREDAARVRGSDRRGVLFDRAPDLPQRRIVAAREVQRKIPEACTLL